MPIDKNIERRLQILDELLSTGKYTKDELLEKLNDRLKDDEFVPIEKRTLYADLDKITELLEKKFPDADNVWGEGKESRKKLWFYAEKHFSIYDKLTPYQAEQLNDILQTIKSFGNIGGLEAFEKTLQELSTKTKESNKKKRAIILLDDNQEYDKDWIPQLYNAICDKQCLIIEYKSFHEEEEQEYVVSPQLLKEYNNRWFLFAWNHEKEYVQNLALDRILDVQKSDKTYTPRSTDWEAYFKDIYGVSRPRDAQKETVVLRFAESTFPYIESKPIHHSQKCNNNDHTVTLQLIINFEIKQLIYSYADKVEVLAPEWLKEEIEGVYRGMKKG
ncbi:MAG: helix-turn-helix transcriptional regulator [Mangrovibacterium sp.]